MTAGTGAAALAGTSGAERSQSRTCSHTNRGFLAPPIGAVGMPSRTHARIRTVEM